ASPGHLRPRSARAGRPASPRLVSWSLDPAAPPSLRRRDRRPGLASPHAPVGPGGNPDPRLRGAPRLVSPRPLAIIVHAAVALARVGQHHPHLPVRAQLARTRKGPAPVHPEPAAA